MKTLTLKKSRTITHISPTTNISDSLEIKDGSKRLCEAKIDRKKLASKTIKDAKDWLLTFPVFREKPVPPLKSQIHKELFLIMAESSCEFSKKDLRKAIYFTVGREYSSRLQKSSTRYDLQMNEAGRV